MSSNDPALRAVGYELSSSHSHALPLPLCPPVQDIGQGRMEPTTEGSSQPMGTEYGQATEQRTSSGSQGGQEKEMSAFGEAAWGEGAPPVSEEPPRGDPEGGRFDEEPTPGDHPYDLSPR